MCIRDRTTTERIKTVDTLAPDDYYDLVFVVVQAGQLGLRQSDALFHHTVALPEMMQELAQEFDLTQIDACLLYTS